MGMLKSRHGLLKRAFLVVTILALMISLLSVGMVQAKTHKPKPPKDTLCCSIEITGAANEEPPLVDSGGPFTTDGNRPGTSFSGGKAVLYLGDDLDGLGHVREGETDPYPLDEQEWTLGDSGFDGNTLVLRFNIYLSKKEVFRLHIYMDVDGKGPSPTPYTDPNAEILVWHLDELRGRGPPRIHTDLVKETTGLVTVTISRL